LNETGPARGRKIQHPFLTGVSAHDHSIFPLTFLSND
jgi:hypothetical protein